MHKEYIATKKQIVRLQLNEKKSKEKGNTGKINELILKSEAYLKDLITYNSHPWIMFF